MEKSHRRACFFTFLVLFTLIFVRYCCFGPEYYPQLDDYIQYHNYTAYHSDLPAFIQTLGLLSSRPLAGLADLYLWAPFFSRMIWAVAILSALYAGTACLLKAVFSRFFHVGWPFLILFTLIPLGFEGLYWVSASSRIVCGLFLAALSGWLFQRFCEGGSPLYMILCAAAQLPAYGFYEQALVFSCTLNLLLMLWNLARSRRLRPLWACWSVANAGLYFLFTHLFAQSSLYGSRMKLVLPTSPSYFTTFLPKLLDQLHSAFVEGGWYTLTRGFRRGLELLPACLPWFLVLVPVLCVLVFLLAKAEPDSEGGRVLPALVFGFLLALAPVTPFFILDNTWFSLRGTVPSFAGLALMADALVWLLVRRWKGRRMFLSALSCGLALVFCIAAVSEVHDYRLTTRSSEQAAQAVLEGTRPLLSELPEEDWADLRIGILNLEPTYLPEQNYHYHEHIAGVTESDWAFTGLLRCRSGSDEFPMVTPLPARFPTYKAYNAKDRRPDTFDLLYCYDPERAEVFPVTARSAGDKVWDLFRSDGVQIGRCYEDEKSVGHLELNF